MHEGYEPLLAYLESQLPRPVDRQEDGADIHFMAGEPPQVMVSLTPSIVVVSEFDGEWDAAGTFRITPRRLGVLHWPHLSEAVLQRLVATLVTAACRARQARFEPCRACDTLTAPEWLRADGLCETCAADDDVIH